MRKSLTLLLLVLGVPLYGQTPQSIILQHLSSFGNTEIGDPDQVCMTFFDGKIFVQDDVGDVVEVFEGVPPYNHLTQFGSGFINQSKDGIIVANGFIFVVDNGNDDIVVFDATTYAYQTTFGGVDISDIEGIAAAGGRLFVSDTGFDDIRVFDLDPPHAFITSFGSTDLSNPESPLYLNGQLFVVDAGTDQVEIFDGTTYTNIGDFGAVEIGDGGEGIAYGDGLFYIIDDEDAQIEVFDATTYQHFGGFGGAQLGNPECIAYGNKRLFVTDDDDNEIEVFVVNKINIPTFSQWGVLIFGLLILNLGLMLIQAKYFGESL